MRLDELSPLQQRVLGWSVVASICVLLVALAEGALRLRHWLRAGSMWGVESTYHLDPESQLRIPIPGLVAGGIRINSMGFRGPEIEVPKPEGRIRVAYLGGSTTYCAEVSSNDAAWPAVVHEALQERYPEVGFDYVNAGVPGYGLSSSLKNLRRRVAALEPDVIVIYHATNDLSANSFDLARERGIVEERTEEEMSWLSRYSLLVYLVEKNLTVMQRQSQAERRTGKLAATGQELSSPFRRDLDELLREAARVAPVVAVASFSSRLRHEQNASERRAAAVTSLYYMPYMTVEGVLGGFDAYNEVIRLAAAEHGVLHIGGEASIPADADHFVDSVHFTDAGSRAMARRVAEALLASAVLRELVETGARQ